MSLSESIVGIRCPYCKTKMNEVPLGPVVIDVCPNCEARWFDRTELAAATHHIAGAGASRFGSAVPGGRIPDVSCPREGPNRAINRYVAYAVGYGRCEGCRGVLFTNQEWAGLEAALLGKRDDDAHNYGSAEEIGLLDFLTFIGNVGSIFLL